MVKWRPKEPLHNEAQLSTKITVYTDAYNANNVEHLKGTRLG